MQATRLVRLSIILVTVLTTAGGCVIIDGSWGPQFKFERTVELQQALQPGATLTAETASGSIHATGHETNQAQVVATITARAGSEETAQRLAEEVNVHFQETGDKVALKADKPTLLPGQSISISYKMDLPRPTSVELSSASGSISVTDLDGSVNAHTASGSVEAERIKGAVRLSSSSGSAHAEQVEGGDARLDSASGGVRLSNASKIGACELHSASGSATAHNVQAASIKMSSASGPVTLTNAQAETMDLHASSGNVRAESIDSSRLKAESVSGNVSAAFVPSAPGNVVADLGTGSGSVDVTLPSAFGGRVDLSTGSGSVRVDLPVTVKGTIGTRHVSGSIGEGSGSLSAHTASGSVHVR